MAEITVRGFVNKPQTKEGGGKSFSTYTLAEGQKQKDGSYKKVYYDAVDFNNPLPDESSVVEVTGWFSVNEYKSKDGTTKQGLRINVQKSSVHKPAPSASADAKDPFAL